MKGKESLIFWKKTRGKILMLNLIPEGGKLVSMGITFVHANNSNSNRSLILLAFSFQRRLKENMELTSLASLGNRVLQEWIINIYKSVMYIYHFVTVSN